MFVNPNARVPVTVDGNTIYILAKMGLGVQAAVNDELVRIKLNLQSFASGEQMNSAEMRVGARTQDLVLLKHNVKKWEGPSFNVVYKYREAKNPNGDTLPFVPLDDLTQELITDLTADELDQLNNCPFYGREPHPRPIPCTPGRIEMLEDFDHPLIAATLEEIRKRNPVRTAEEEKKELKPSKTDGNDD